MWVKSSSTIGVVGNELNVLFISKPIKRILESIKYLSIDLVTTFVDLFIS